jgi:NF-X1-type zinc finger protein NFXL1
LAAAAAAAAAVDCSDALFAKGLLRVQQYLAGGRDNTTCPICLGGIKPTEAIWACGKSCYALFHMTCIQVRQQAG